MKINSIIVILATFFILASSIDFVQRQNLQFSDEVAFAMNKIRSAINAGTMYEKQYEFDTGYENSYWGQYLCGEGPFNMQYTTDYYGGIYYSYIRHSVTGYNKRKEIVEAMVDAMVDAEQYWNPSTKTCSDDACALYLLLVWGSHADLACEVYNCEISSVQYTQAICTFGHSPYPDFGDGSTAPYTSGSRCTSPTDGCIRNLQTGRDISSYTVDSVTVKIADRGYCDALYSDQPRWWLHKDCPSYSGSVDYTAIIYNPTACDVGTVDPYEWCPEHNIDQRAGCPYYCYFMPYDNNNYPIIATSVNDYYAETVVTGAKSSQTGYQTVYHSEAYSDLADLVARGFDNNAYDDEHIVNNFLTSNITIAVTYINEPYIPALQSDINDWVATLVSATGYGAHYTYSTNTCDSGYEKDCEIYTAFRNNAGNKMGCASYEDIVTGVYKVACAINAYGHQKVGARTW